MKNNNKYYLISNKSFANTIRFLTGMSYREFNNQNHEGKKIFSFKNTEELQNALAKIMELRNELKK